MAIVLYSLDKDELAFLNQRGFFSKDCLNDWKLTLLDGDVVVDFSPSPARTPADFTVRIFREGFDNTEFINTSGLRNKIIDNLKFVAEKNYKRVLEAKKKEEENKKKEEEKRISLENTLLKDLMLDGDMKQKKEEPKKERKSNVFIIETVLDSKGVPYVKTFNSKKEHDDFLEKRKKDPKNNLAGFTGEDRVGFGKKSKYLEDSLLKSWLKDLGWDDF